MYYMVSAKMTELEERDANTLYRLMTNHLLRWHYALVEAGDTLRCACYLPCFAVDPTASTRITVRIC